MKGINITKQTIKTIVTIFILCLVSLAWAEEKKEESKIEPKLVYEKRFDFEIEQGKIGDDTIYQAIYITKNHVIRTINNRGQITKPIKAQGKYVSTISGGGNHIIIYYGAEDWWKEDVKKAWQVFDYSGKLITGGSYMEPYLSGIQIFHDGERIVKYGATHMDMVDIEFYDNMGNLLNSYTIEKLIADTTAVYHWIFTQTYGVANTYIVGAITNEKDKTWIVVFDADGRVIWKEQISDMSIWDIAISPNGRYINYTTSREKSQLEYHYPLIIIDRIAEVTMEYEIEQYIWKDKEVSLRNLNFTTDSKWFYYISSFNMYYLFNIEKMINLSQNIPHLKWYGSTDESITDAVVSRREPLYIGIVVNNNELVLLSCNGKELFRIQDSYPIIDTKIDALEKKLYILRSNSLKIYSW